MFVETVATDMFVQTDVRTDMFLQTEVRMDMFVQTTRIKIFLTSIMTKQFFMNCLGQGESIDTFEAKIHQEMGELEVSVQSFTDWQIII